MTRRPKGQKTDPDSRATGAAAPSPADTWQDWVTIWQSELNALATDREAQQAWARLVEIWVMQARAAGAFLPAHSSVAPEADGESGRAGTEPSAGAAATSAASNAGDPEKQRLALERLAKRVEELERRLAELGGDGKG